MRSRSPPTASTSSAVIIGGGPKGEAARELQSMFAVPVIAPIPSAVTRIIRLVAARAGN
ncbi:Asp/Glu/hydantoin racemase [Bradyrhizobium sp. LA2.1]